MVERPILFSGPMVRAILEGRKTQTRRVVKFKGGQAITNNDRKRVWDNVHKRWEGCPFGQPGDRLYVREAWAYFGGDEYLYQRNIGSVHYKQDYDSSGLERMVDASRSGWRPSIHMPRWASRINLEITNVWVQKLREIDNAESAAEGAEREITGGEGTPGGDGYRRGFMKLWDSINAARGYGWDMNPWVWSITFRRLTE